SSRAAHRGSPAIGDQDRICGRVLSQAGWRKAESGKQKDTAWSLQCRPILLFGDLGFQHLSTEMLKSNATVFTLLASGLPGRVSSDIASEIDKVSEASSVKYLFLKVGKVTTLGQRFTRNAEPTPRSAGRCEAFPASIEHV